MLWKRGRDGYIQLSPCSSLIASEGDDVQSSEVAVRVREDGRGGRAHQSLVDSKVCAEKPICFVEDEDKRRLFAGSITKSEPTFGFMHVGPFVTEAVM